jgi:hypothetical protein
VAMWIDYHANTSFTNQKKEILSMEQCFQSLISKDGVVQPVTKLYYRKGLQSISIFEQLSDR